MQKRLQKLFADYYKDVYLYLYSLCRDSSLAEDLAGETFLEAVRSIAGFRKESSPKTWLFSIARHRWYHWCRSRHRQPETEMLSEFLENPEQSVENRTDDRELAGRVRQLLEEQPERIRGIVRMRMEGYSFHEIGERYGISENSARVIEFRTKNKIRELLKKEGFTDE